MTALLLVPLAIACAGLVAVVWATGIARRTVDIPDGSRGTRRD